ncbi:dTDP-6-deoxy-3,4-keto-hexulose isomerase [Alkalihalophilus pseudofirmus]|nr:dTDP-6-deoxy-3,4-keto-hexulose isomerase [Alkalihalophilus pseudofirmus]
MLNVQLINFKTMGDDRGSLIALEGNKNIPFEIKRVYYIFDTINNIRRGFHAHKELKQLLICVSGSCKVFVTDGATMKDINLNSRSQGLLIGSMVWREMYDFSPDCVLLVLASEYYSEKDYIRNYDEFLNIGKKTKKQSLDGKDV